MSDDEISQNVTDWAFQEIPPAQVPQIDGEDSELSLVETEARQSFLEMCDERKEEGNTDFMGIRWKVKRTVKPRMQILRPRKKLWGFLQSSLRAMYGPSEDG